MDPGRIIPGVAACPVLAQDPGADDVVNVILDWVQSYLAMPHPDLGRSGPVCPFTPGAIARQTLRVIPVHLGADREADVEAALTTGKDFFLRGTRKVDPARAIYYSSLFVFPQISHDEARFIIERVKNKLKPAFVESGLMLGEFYENNLAPGLHNPEFHPLQSPIPMLVVRYMVPSDIAFLDNPGEVTDQRIRYLESYLKHQPAISPKERQRVVEVIASLRELARSS